MYSSLGVGIVFSTLNLFMKYNPNASKIQNMLCTNSPFIPSHTSYNAIPDFYQISINIIWQENLILIIKRVKRFLF